MSNRLSMAAIHSIETPHRSGHCNREIVRLLGVDRGAVNKYIRRLQALCGRETRGPAAENPQTGAAQNRSNPQTDKGSRP